MLNKSFQIIQNILKESQEQKVEIKLKKSKSNPYNIIFLNFLFGVKSLEIKNGFKF